MFASHCAIVAKGRFASEVMEIGPEACKGHTGAFLEAVRGFQLQLKYRNNHHFKLDVLASTVSRLRFTASRGRSEEGHVRPLAAGRSKVVRHCRATCIHFPTRWVCEKDVCTSIIMESYG